MDRNKKNQILPASDGGGLQSQNQQQLQPSQNDVNENGLPNIMFTHGIPVKPPKDLYDLIENLRSLEEVSMRIDRYFDAVDEQVDAVSNVLNETTANRDQTARNLKEYYLGLGPEHNQQQHFRNQTERDRAKQVVRMQNSMYVAEKRLQEVKRSTASIKNPVKVSVVQDAQNKDVLTKRYQDFQNLAQEVQINKMMRNVDKAQELEECASKFQNEINWNNKWKVRFEGLNQKNDNKRQHAIEQKKIWMQANFENTDPNFHKEWKAKMDDQSLLCGTCRNEFFLQQKQVLQASTDSDSDEELKNVKLSDDALLELEEMRVRNKRCKKCSQIWCDFTEKMLNKYIDDAFGGADSSRKFQIKTLIDVDQRGTQEIVVDVETKPSFLIIDDDIIHDQKQQQYQGKRVIYYTKIESVSCQNSHFDASQFKLTLNAQSQFRMDYCPFRIKQFSLGYFEEQKDDPNGVYDKKAYRDHTVTDVLKSQFSPENSLYQRHDLRMLQTGLLSRYQRYCLMSRIPVGIMVRIINQRFFQSEVQNIQAFYADRLYNHRTIPWQDRTAVANRTYAEYLGRNYQQSGGRDAQKVNSNAAQKQHQQHSMYSQQQQHHQQRQQMHQHQQQQQHHQRQLNQHHHQQQQQHQAQQYQTAQPHHNHHHARQQQQ